MYAIFETGGKQYKVEVGDILYIEKLELEAEETAKFDKVVAINDKKLILGTPFVAGATVEGKIEKHGKGKKIHVFTYRSKKGSKRALGHRQPYTKIQITAING